MVPTRLPSEIAAHADATSVRQPQNFRGTHDDGGNEEGHPASPRPMEHQGQASSYAHDNQKGVRMDERQQSGTDTCGQHSSKVDIAGFGWKERGGLALC